MNFKKTKLITALLSCNFFISNIGALEVLEIKMLDEYVITREFPGKLIPAEQSKLAFEIPGKINSINVDIGDEVILGEELAALDGRESLAQLNQSKAKYELAQNNKRDLPYFDSDIKKQQGHWHIALRQTDLCQCTRKPHTVQQPKTTGQPPGVMTKQTLFIMTSQV